MQHNQFQNVSMNLIEDLLIVTIDRDLDEIRLENIQEAVLDKIISHTVKGVILDFSSVEILDSYLAKKVNDLSKMIEVMGNVAVIAGLRAEVIASLVILGFTPDNLTTALNVEHGVEHLKSLQHPAHNSNNETKEEIEEEAPEQASEPND